MAGLAAICACGKEHRTNALSDSADCPDCQRIEAEMFANDPMPVHPVEYQPWRYSQAAMKDRLGVTGNEDV